MMYLFFIVILSYLCSNVQSVSSLSQGLKTNIILLFNHSSKEPFKRALRDRGIFEDFLEKLLDLLSDTFPDKKLVKYCKLMHRMLRYTGYRFTKKLSKHFYDLSIMYRDEIRGVMQQHRQELYKNLPHRREFLQAMNEVFNLQDKLLFSDYVLDLRDYGNDDKRFIHEETSRIINDVILNGIYKLSGKEQNQLEKKLKRAIKEYENESY